jgi:DUF971 family protein
VVTCPSIIADDAPLPRSNRPFVRRRPAVACAYNPLVTDETTASRIHADRAAGTLQIGWADGHETTYDAVTLRWLCPCAFCRGEAGLPGWLDSRPTLSSDQTRLVDVQLVGQYAIAPTWGDGHHTGYYTFALLRDRCPCEACTARRVREADRTSGSRPVHADHDHRIATVTTTAKESHP